MSYLRLISHLGTLAQVKRGINKFGYSFPALLYAGKNSSAKLIWNDSEITYSQLLNQAIQQAYFFKTKYNLKQSDEVVLVGNQSMEWLIALFALSALGTKIYLINSKFGAATIQHLLGNIDSKLIFMDAPTQSFLQFKDAEIIETTGNQDISNEFLSSLSKNKASIVNLTSGSSGKPKSEHRKLTVLPYVKVFTSLIRDLKLSGDKNVLIGIPCSHGYGLASLLTAITLKKDIYLSQSQNETFELLDRHQIDCWISLPTQLNHFFKQTDGITVAPKKIITGSELINSDLVKQILDTDTALYNLFGTTETGVISLATPEMLKLEPNTVGKPIEGVKYKLKNAANNTYELWVNSPWKSDNYNNYISTGDKIYVTKNGFWVHAGRIDKKVIINGYLVDFDEIKNILNANLPHLNVSIEWQNKQLEFVISTNNGLDRTEDEKRINELLPRHARPDRIVWEK